MSALPMGKDDFEDLLKMIPCFVVCISDELSQLFSFECLESKE